MSDMKGALLGEEDLQERDGEGQGTMTYMCNASQ